MALLLDDAQAGRFPEAAEVVAAAGLGRWADRWVVDGYEAVAQFFGCTDRTVKAWARDGMPGGNTGRGVRGRLDLKAVGSWLFQRWRKEQVLTVGGGNSPAMEELRRIHVNEARLDFAERQGELTTKAEALAAINATVTACVAGLTGLRERLTRLFPDAADEISITCEAAAAQVREAMTAYDDTTEGPQHDRADAVAADPPAVAPVAAPVAGTR